MAHQVDDANAGTKRELDMENGRAVEADDKDEDEDDTE